LDLIDSSGDDNLVIDASSGQDTILIPDHAWLQHADFVRQGSDLLLVGDDGKKILVRDYFNLENPPDLVTRVGGVFDAKLVASLAGPVAPGEYAQAAGGATEPIGKIETISGIVQITRVDGTKVTAKKGDDIFQGDVVETGADASIGMVLADDSVFSLDADARAVLDEMVYDPGEQTGNLGISLISGVMSFVSGQISKSDPDAMVLKTPLATIGIRGTSGSVESGETTQVVLTEEAGGSVGEIVVKTAGGVQVLNSPLQSTNISDPTQPPPAPVVLSAEAYSQKFGASVAAVNNTLSAAGLPTLPPPTDAATPPGEQQGEGGPEGFKAPREGSDFGKNTAEDMDKVRGELDKARQEELALREQIEKSLKFFDKFQERFEKDVEQKFQQLASKFLRDIQDQVGALTTNNSEIVAPILALIQKANAAGQIASAAESAAAAKKVAVEAEVVAKGVAAGLDQSSSNSLSSAVTAPLDALGAASALAATSSGIMLSAGALLGSFAAGNTINP